MEGPIHLMEQGLHASERRETSERSVEVYPQSAAFPIRSATDHSTIIELVYPGHGLQDPRDIRGRRVGRARLNWTGCHLGASDEGAVGLKEPDVECDWHVQHPIPHRSRGLVDEEHPVGPSRDLLYSGQTDLALRGSVGDEDIEGHATDLYRRGLDVRLPGAANGNDQQTDGG